MICLEAQWIQNENLESRQVYFFSGTDSPYQTKGSHHNKVTPNPEECTPNWGIPTQKESRNLSGGKQL